VAETGVDESTALVSRFEAYGETPASPMMNRLDSCSESLLSESPVHLSAMTPANEVSATDKQNRINALLGNDLLPASVPASVTIKSVTVVESPAECSGQLDPMCGAAASGGGETVSDSAAEEVPLSCFPKLAHAGSAAPVVTAVKSGQLSESVLVELWDHEFRSARRKLEPDGALTGATRELQAALGTFLTVCHEHGVKVGPWRLQHVVPEWPFGDHPTYGVVALAHWACKDGQPWKVGVGLFLARGAGKPKDLEIKLAVMDTEPQVVDHLILLRPEDDLTLTGKSKTLWADSERRGKSARLEPVSLDGYALLSSFPRWLAAVRESLPEGTPIPNLADVIQQKAEKLLEQVCMPVQ
jgi:hypothetical protein